MTFLDEITITIIINKVLIATRKVVTIFQTIINLKEI